MSYKFGSFNMFKFSYQSNKEISKNLNKIAMIIKDNNLQIVALQEVFSKEALNTLLNILGNQIWKGCWESPPAKTKNAAEGYAFIWNSMFFNLVETNLDDGTTRKFIPHVYNQYKVDKKIGQQKLIRNPYYARFSPTNDLRIEFRLINTHIMFSRSKTRAESNEEIIDISDAKMRNNEFKILTECIYPKIADTIYKNNLVIYTIMMGDYNLNINTPETKSPYLNNSITIEEAPKGKHAEKKIVTIQEQLTTLKMPPKDSSKPDPNINNYWANNYDHFTYDAIRFKKIGIKTYRVNTVKDCASYIKHRQEISDHVPVIMEIDLKNKGE